MLKYDKPLKTALSPEKADAQESPQEQRLEQRGENVAFAVESVLTCFATDFIDPVIGYFFQRQHAKSHGHAEHGSPWQNVVGEVGGDVFSAIVLVGAEEIAPKQMDALGVTIGNALDPVYRKMAAKSLHLDLSKPEDNQRYQQWKTYQQDNLARTAVMSVAGVVGNVAVQKTPWVHNPSPAHVIAKGKVAGAAITAAVVLGSRLALPDTTKKIDGWLSRHAFAPILKHTDRLLGRKEMAEEPQPATVPSENTHVTSWVNRTPEPSPASTLGA